MGDVIDMYTKARYMGDEGIDPDDEIEVTMTIAQAMAVMDMIWVRHDDYEQDDATPLLEDLFMDLQNEIWPEEE